MEQIVEKKVKGMTCSGCERRIERKLRKLSGMVEARADYGNSTVNLTYDRSLVTPEEIVVAIEQLDYRVASNSTTRKNGGKQG